MIADEDGGAVIREVFEAGGFDAPVVFGKEVEKMAATVDVFEVRSG
jgi:hypothetical protein